MYEVNLLGRLPLKEFDVKQEIKNKIEKMHSENNLKKDIIVLKRFGDYLFENHIGDIITTNYDKGIELILCKKCGYKEIEPEGFVKETIYSIRTYKKFENKEKCHQINLWKIHGDMDRIKSMTLGFDQYCGALAKLSQYIKGEYQSSKGPECTVPMIEKCEKQKFDNLSWAELFFTTNVYIVGLGMDFSEIDIWWLLNKHASVLSR